MLKAFKSMSLLFRIAFIVGVLVTIGTFGLITSMIHPIATGNLPKPTPTQTALYLKGFLFRVDAKVDKPIPDQKLWLRIEELKYENGVLTGAIGTLVAEKPSECALFYAITGFNGSNHASVRWLCTGNLKSQEFSDLSVYIPGLGTMPAYADGFDTIDLK